MSPEALDSLDKPDLIALVLKLAEQNRILTEQVATLTARVASLEARLMIPPKTPGNSSLPPSKGAKANLPETPKKRRKGRPGVARALCPNPDRVREVYATSCTGCGGNLTPADQPDVHAYDHTDLPPIAPVTTRVHLHSGDCPCCGERVAATAPADMPVGKSIRPRHRSVGGLSARLPDGQLQPSGRNAERLVRLDLERGRHRQHVGPSRAALRRGGQAHRSRGSRRPGHCQRRDLGAGIEGITCWQWVFGSASAVFHRIAVSRSAAVVTAFLQSAQPEVWVSDRLGAQMGHAKQCFPWLAGGWPA